MPTIRKHGRKRPWKTPAVRAKKAPGDGVRRFTPDGEPVKSWDTTAQTGAERDPRLKTQRWQRVRMKVLRANPLCEICMHDNYKVVPAEQVDHIEPRVDDIDNFYDTVNLWALCKKCHHIKTVAESKRIRYLERIQWIRYVINKRKKGVR